VNPVQPIIPKRIRDKISLFIGEIYKKIFLPQSESPRCPGASIIVEGID